MWNQWNNPPLPSQIAHRQEGEIRLDQSMRGFWDDITGETASELEEQVKQKRYYQASTLAFAIIAGVIAYIHWRKHG